MKEYRMKSAVGLMYVCGVIAVGIWAIPFYLEVSDPAPTSSSFYSTMFTILAVLLGFIAAGVVDVKRSIIIVDNEKITLQSLTINRELYFNEIKGFRKGKDCTIVESALKGKKNLPISVYFDNKKELLDFLKTRFPDLDNEEKQEVTESVLQNKAYGATREKRGLALKGARLLSIGYNCIGILIVLTSLFLRDLDTYTMPVWLLIPVIGIGINLFSRGLIRITFNEKSFFSNIAFGFMMPIIFLFASVILSVNLLDYVSVWVFAVSIGVVLLMVVLVGNLRYRPRDNWRYTDSILIFPFLCLYGYGVVLTINTLYDNSSPELYQASVLDKYTSTSKSTTYHLNLASWEKRPETDEVLISLEKYNRIQKGDKVTIYLYQGLLNIPWYVVSDE